jgi:uncharacterized protein (TIGR02246 family)
MSFLERAMLTRILFKSLIALCVLLNSFVALATNTEELAVRALPQRIVDGWNRADGDALASVYAEDGILVAGHGVVKHGREQIASYHEELFATSIKGTRLTVEVVNVRFLDRTTAILQTKGGILWPGETTLAPRNVGIQSFVAVKNEAGWRVVLFQNTRIVSPGED